MKCGRISSFSTCLSVTRLPATYQRGSSQRFSSGMDWIESMPGWSIISRSVKALYALISRASFSSRPRASKGASRIVAM